MKGFAGFGPGATEFLRDLAANNDRAWFLAHKAVYEREVVAPMRLLLADVISGLSARGIPLTGDPAKSIYRIHRDVRFSHDKLPYKTHAGAILTRDGTKNFSGLLYFHVAPEGSFLAAGFYHPEREALGALREAIYTDPDRFAAIQADLKKAKLAFDETESLQRMPRGFEDAAGTPMEAALRLKSFVIQRPVSPARLASAALVGDALAFAETVLPLLEFGWSALTVLDPTALTRQKR